MGADKSAANPRVTYSAVSNLTTNSRNLSRALTVEGLPPSALKPDPRNPRRHSDRQINQISRSITSFGFNVPVLIDQRNRIVAGHGRVQAAKKLGLDRVPVIRLEHLSAAQAQAFAIADNRLADVATWDDRLLGEIFSELAALDLDFSLEDTGFTMAEIDLRIEGLSEASGGAPDPADQILDDAGHPAITRRGDVWHLGAHRLLCGNAVDAAAYEALLQGEQARAVFTDPPYNVPIQGYVSGKGAIRHREFAMASGEMTEGQFTHFLTSVAHLLVQHSAAGSVHYICMDWRHQRSLLAAGYQAYAKLIGLCIWVKDNAGMGSFYRSKHELVYVFRNGTAPHRNNVQLGQFGRNRTNVWNYPGVTGFGRRGEEGNLLALHPTVKPVAMVADALLDCTARGELVLDPFLGSGTTLIAAQRVGRTCYAMEIDPLYVDTAIRRWQRYTGELAIHAATGRRFDDVAASRVAP
jgi:DNA modification methylase